MDVQAYRVAVRLALDDQITRNMMQVAKDAIELNKKFGEIAKNIKAVTSAAKEATSAIRSMNNALSNQFSGASRGANEYANNMRAAADHAVRASNAVKNLPALAGGYGAALALPALVAGSSTSRGGGGGYGNAGGMLALPSPSGRGTGWNGWNNGVPPGGWGGGGSDGGSGNGSSGDDYYGRRRGSDGMTNLATGYLGYEFIKNVSDKGVDYERYIARMRQMGLDDNQIASSEKYVNGMKMPYMSNLDTMRVYTDAQGSFRQSGMTGDQALQAAKVMTPLLAQYETAMSGLGGESHAAADQNMRNLNKTVEIMNGLADTKRAAEIVDAVFKSSQASGRLVDENQLKQFVAYGSSATNHQGIRAIFGGLEPIIAEMGGSTTAVGLRTAYTRMNGMMSLPPKLLQQEMQRLGIADKTGRKQTEDLYQLEATNAIGYAQRMMEIYKQHGITKPTDIERENSILFGTNGAKIYNRIMAQMSTIEEGLHAYDRSKGSADVVNDPNNKQIFAQQKLMAKWIDLQLVLAKDGGLLDTFTSGLDKLSTTMQRMTEIAHRNPELAKFVGQAALAVTGLAAVSGGFWIIKHAAGALISPLKLAGWGIDLLIGRTATTGLTGLATALGGLPALITAVIAAALYPTSTASQTQENAEIMRLGRQNAGDNGGTYKPWSPTQADFDNQRAREQAYRKNGKYPAIPPVSGSAANQPVNLMMTHEGRQVLVATVVNGMSKQATKAPSSTSAYDSSMLMVYPGQVSKLSTQ